MATVTTSVRIDPKIKADAQVIAKKLGMNLSTVVNAYLAQFVRERRLNVGIDEEWFGRETQSEILSAIRSRGAPGWVEFKNGQDMVSYLRAASSPETVIK